MEDRQKSEKGKSLNQAETSGSEQAIVSGLTDQSQAIDMITRIERERDILLGLSSDLTKVRDKDDLLMFFSSRIKKLFHFAHSSITLIDEKREYYTPFLLDIKIPSILNHEAYDRLALTHFKLNEPIIGKVLELQEPVSYVLEDILHNKDVPPFLKINYEGGIREVMFTPLNTQGTVIGFINIYATEAGNFSEDFKRIMKGLSPLLSTAVQNIITNAEISKREATNQVLLALSNHLATARNKKEVVKVLNNGLRRLFDFSHSLIVASDETGSSYSAFAFDQESRPEEKSKYITAISEANAIEDGIYDVASHSYHAVVFDMKAQDLRKTPLWFRLNYAVGSRELLIKMLPNGDKKKFSLILFSDQAGTFNAEVVEIIERIASPLSGIVRNIEASENIFRKDKEKSFLLDFSRDIAAVRKKDELETAISKVLKEVLGIRLSMIRIIDEDGRTLSPYMFDTNMFNDEATEFKTLASKKIPIEEVLTAKVLSSREPVIFNIDAEEKAGNSAEYIKFWKKVGLKNAFGAALRTGNRNIGTLWLLTDEINLSLLRGICAQISISISNILANEKIWYYQQKLEIENTHLHEQIKGLYNFSDIVGEGKAMQNVYQMMSAVTESSTTVLILGETGTGKELIARAVHNASSRHKKIMVKVNCAALPPNLIESELFGHEKGAFTGAYDKRIGKFELAHEGTLFLDEVGELPLELQVKLLRVLQEKEFESVGGKTTIKADVRIIAATNRNLAAEVNAGRFRSDLFYRLNVFPILLPPLRERIEDIEPLTRFFIARYSKKNGIGVNSISPKALLELKKYSWPGNIRELEHLIERSILLSTDSTLQEVHVPKIKDDTEKSQFEFISKTLEEMEREYIIEILRSCQGKISGGSGAAEILGIPPSTLHSKMKKLGINRGHYFPA